MNLNHPEATQQALSILRSCDPFQWYVITLLAVVVYIYFNEIQNKNWKGIAAGLWLYMVHCIQQWPAVSQCILPQFVNKGCGIKRIRPYISVNL